MATTPTSEKEKEQRSAAASPNTPSSPSSPANFGVNLPNAASVFVGSAMDNMEGMLRLTSADRRQVRSRSRPPPNSPFVPMQEKGPHKFSYVQEEKSERVKRRELTPRPGRTPSDLSLKTANSDLSLKTAIGSASPSYVSTSHSTLPDFADTSVGSSPSTNSSNLDTAVRMPSSTCTAVSPTSPSLRSPRPAVRAHVSRFEQAKLDGSLRGKNVVSKSSEYMFAKSPGENSLKSPGTKTPPSAVVSSGLPTAKSPSTKSSEKSQPLSENSLVHSPVAKSSGYPTAKSPSIGSPAVATGVEKSPSSKIPVHSPASEKSSGYPTARSPTVRSVKSPVHEKIVKSTPPMVYASRFDKSPLEKDYGLYTAVENSPGVTTAMENSPLQRSSPMDSRVSKRQPRRPTPAARFSLMNSPSMATAIELSAKSPVSSQKSSGLPTALSPSVRSPAQHSSKTMVTARSPTPTPHARSPRPLIGTEPAAEKKVVKAFDMFPAPSPAVVVRQPSLADDREFVAPKTSEIFDTQHPTRLSRGTPEIAGSTMKSTGVGPKVQAKSDGTNELTMICGTGTPGQTIRLRFNIDSIMEAHPGVRGKESPLSIQELALNNVTVWKQ